jgi:site-specific DNA-cytosine methylase
MVFEQVCADLERAGYEVQPFIIPACAVDAPHRRDRIWIVAHRTDTGIESVPERENGVFKSETVADADKLYGHLPGLRAGEVPQFETSGIRDNIYRPDSHANKKRLKRWNGDRKTVLKALHQEFNFHSTSGGRGKNDKSVCAGQPGQNIPDWRKFPTQSPVRKRNDGFPNRVVRYITKELYYEISKTGKENRIENLPEVWERISQEEIWKEIRRFYSLESKDILLQTMQLYSGAYFGEIALSPFSDVFSEKILQHLRKYGEFRCSPHGRKLQKQRSIQFGNALSFLPHEVALAAKKIEKAAVSFNSWHRAESIRAFGSAIVPQVAYEFFKIINNLNNSQL